MVLLGIAFFLSGAAALVYQVVWQRILTLHTGIGVVSVALIVAAFMAGLGLGSQLGGRAERARLARAGRCGCSPCWSSGWASSPRSAAGSTTTASAPSPRASTDDRRRGGRALRRLPAAHDTHGHVAALPRARHGPRDGLGLARHRRALRHQRAGSRGRRPSRALGADALPRDGGGGARGRGRQPRGRGRGARRGPPGRAAPTARRRPPRRPPVPSEPLRAGSFRLWTLLYALSGFLALSLEIVWFRLMDVGVKSTAFTFGTVLCLYLLGLGVGSLVGGRRAERLARPLQAFLDYQLLLLVACAGAAVALLAEVASRDARLPRGSSTTGGTTRSSSSARTGTRAPCCGSTACCLSRSTACPPSSWGSRSGRCSARCRTTPPRAAARSGSSRPPTSPAALPGASSPASSSSSGSAPPARCACSSPPALVFLAGPGPGRGSRPGLVVRAAALCSSSLALPSNDAPLEAAPRRDRGRAARPSSARTRAP